MDSLEKNIYIGSLYNFYKNLLTQKQCNIFTSYYFNDIGLTEIASNLGITKQTVLDSIKQTEKKLLELENSLNLLKIYNNQTKIIEDIKANKNLSNLDKIISLWEE